MHTYTLTRVLDPLARLSSFEPRLLLSQVSGQNASPPQTLTGLDSGPRIDPGNCLMCNKVRNELEQQQRAYSSH